MFYTLLLILFIISCLFLLTVILIQAGRGEGLAGVFGGENMQQMLGAQAPDILEKITWGTVIVFFSLTIVLSLMTSRNNSSIVDSAGLPEPASQQQTVPTENTPQPDMQIPAEDIQIDTTTPDAQLPEGN